MTVHQAPAGIPPTIRAHIADTAIDRVTRFFNATECDAFTELLQNARRACASTFSVAATPLDHGGFLVSCADDGHGVHDPRLLLAFGDSGWDATVRDAEDPAGIGVYALSRRGCSISSRPLHAPNQPEPGWRVQLTPDTFLGRDEAPVLPDECAPHPHGTRVSFVSDWPVERIGQALADAARHCPLRVDFNGLEVPRKAFLDGAVHAWKWRGIVFGVFRDRAAYRDPDLNFHGLTLEARLPRISDIDGRAWSVRADIESCPDLELVLPARKEPVETPFLEEMRDAAKAAIWRAMAAADPPPAIAFGERAAAAAAGIDIPAAPPRLRPWRPAIADTDDWRDAPPFANLPADAMIVAWDREPPDEQAFHRAAERAGIEQRFVEAHSWLEGYDWYDFLHRVVGMTVRIVHEGTALDLDDLREARKPRGKGKGAPLPRRPDEIRIELHVEPPGGERHTVSVPADVVFGGEAWCYVSDIQPIVAAAGKIQPHVLAALMRAGYFSASDDCAADSWETQRDRFTEDAMHEAMKLLASEDEARIHSIAEAVRREMFWLVPRDRRVSIVIDKGSVDVDIAPGERAA